MRAVGILCLLASAATASGIRDIDFRNYSYEWEEPGDRVPNQWRWLAGGSREQVRLVDGKHPFGGDLEPYVHLVAVTFGDLDGAPGDEAAVDLL